jgi:putative transposase
MVEYRKSSHAIWDVKYHVVWITKYRFKVLRGEIAVRTRDLLRQICEGREVVVVQGSVSPVHVHMLVSVPPQLANTSKASSGKIQGRTSKSPRQTRLKTALSREPFRRLQPQTGDFQSQSNLPAFSR